MGQGRVVDSSGVGRQRLISAVKRHCASRFAHSKCDDSPCQRHRPPTQRARAACHQQCRVVQRSSGGCCSWGTSCSRGPRESGSFASLILGSLETIPELLEALTGNNVNGNGVNALTEKFRAWNITDIASLLEAVDYCASVIDQQSRPCTAADRSTLCQRIRQPAASDGLAGASGVAAQRGGGRAVRRQR